ncbi:sensor histidine kinase efflux regulator BaeS [Collimonas silvisoli]|uniref:sensor histidine kinase efflux regulator BaeS n=1 Tax=Collimonas silvisoli TaxID=2825884 RepID=UPI001B8BB75F|nr:sensor histidine kinase efflux regulator BaeS [Collimonas silvisoli]
MKISISAKIFLAVLTACAAVLLAQALILRITVREDFFDYLNAQGLDRMDETLPRLAVAYRKSGSWDFLHDNFKAWIVLVMPQQKIDRLEIDPSIADQTGAIVRMGLLNKDLVRIAGNRFVDANSIRRPVIVDGQVVGWIAIVPFQKMLSPNETLFLAKQRKMWWIFGAASIGFIALFTFLLTYTLRQRVRRLAYGTHLLATGDYTSRIAIEASDEIGALAQDFNRMAQALEHNERARRTFMADISHELRTPLAVVRAELEAIQDGVRTSSKQSLEAMHQEVQQLGKLIDDLHDLALTDVGALAYRRMSIDVSTILYTALNGMRGRFDSAGLHLDVNIPTMPLIVSGDESRLQQLFANLLENTLRYTDTGGQVHISCLRTTNTVNIVIEDSAPGVPEEKISHLFDRFYRVESSRNRANGGSGLGLAICRNIVEAHDGKISVGASRLGGLRISIALELTIQ